MVTPLEKARQAPDSMKAKILTAARRVFGEYGFHGTTTRMIAKEVGVDISTLYYHWGEKGDLYEAVTLDIYDDLRRRLGEVEGVVRGRSLIERMETAIDMMTDYLFDCPEISNLILFRYFAKTRHHKGLEIHVPELVSDIARSMNLCEDEETVPARVRMRVLAMMNAIHNFISGENFFRPMLNLDRNEYIAMVKETLNFLLIPAFVGSDSTGSPQD
jgi:AcrR family transcriptional regulator